MELKLAKGEQIIKQWDYAVSGAALSSKKKKVHYNLTVTNKRIISSSYNDIQLDRAEIPLKSVKTLEGNFKKNRSFWAYVKLVIGIPLCLIIVGIGMVKSALETLRGCAFELSFTTSGLEGSSLVVGAAGGTTATKASPFSNLFKSLNTTKVNVNKEIAKEVLDEIGAIVLEQQEA